MITIEIELMNDVKVSVESPSNDMTEATNYAFAVMAGKFYDLFETWNVLTEPTN